MASFSPIKNKLMMQGGPAPGPYQDVSQEAYPMGTTAKASPMPQSPANPLSSAFMPQQRKPDAMSAFAETLERTLTPDAAKMRVEEEKTGQADKLKQGLAFVKQLRALPMNQRYQMAQQGVKQFGLNASLDPAGFTDEALAQSEAALSAQAGIGPVVPEPMSAYEAAQIRLREQELAKTGADKLTTEVGGNGNYWSFNTASGQMEDTGVKAPAAKINGEGGAQGVQSVHIDQTSGRATAVMRDGSIKDLGFQPVQTQVMSVGGVPTIVSKIPGSSSEQIVPLSEVAGNEAAVASAQVQGKAQGQAAFDLPGIEFRSQTAINSINDLKSRNIGQRFGLQGKLYAIPGTEGADVQSLVRQVTSQAFLNAFDQLRGAGAITEREGQAATEAITRLQNQDISVGEALKAMNELQRYYRNGIQVARNKAVKAPVLPGRPAGATGTTRTRVGVPPLLAKPTPSAASVPDGVDPADWEFMTPEQKALFQ
jgi:hypothetical protein